MKMKIHKMRVMMKIKLQSQFLRRDGQYQKSLLVLRKDVHVLLNIHLH